MRSKREDQIAAGTNNAYGADALLEKPLDEPKKNAQYSIDRLRAAKQRFLAKCRGPRAVCPIEPATVGCIIDQFLAELK